MHEKTTDGHKWFCVVDKQEVPAERRKKKAITCSEECAKTYAKLKRTITDEKKCRFCNRPSTPLERKLYQRFKRTLKKSPHLLMADEYKNFVEEQQLLEQGCQDKRRKFPITPEAFAEHFAEQLEAEDAE